MFFKHQSPERKSHSNEYACSTGTRHNVAFGRFGLVSFAEEHAADFFLHILEQQICKEALIWQSLQHPSILPFIGIDQETFPGYLCIASPWMEQGTVLKYLESHGTANVDRLVC
jgi:serine/threonine protein kinase